MCGIVGAVAQQNVTPLLLEGLKRLEYRGYDSAGIAVIDEKTRLIKRVRREGKVSQLAQALNTEPVRGFVGIAHTRWATHGAPSEHNAHPLMSNDSLALVHNGIIENHDVLHKQLIELGYTFTSETDTEVIVHLLDYHLKQNDFLTSVRLTVQQLIGAFALAIVYKNEPGRIITVRNGSPLVIGLGQHEYFIASDTLALLPLTQQFIYLEEGDIADVSQQGVVLYDMQGNILHRNVHVSHISHQLYDRGHYRHYMLKEIFEQPAAVQETLDGRISKDHILEQAFGTHAKELFNQIKRIQIAACGTSYHAGMIGRYWLEGLAGIPCYVEIASELRYRQAVVQPDTLFIAISQSGETADTLAALRQAKQLGYTKTLSICNVPESSLVREADFVLLTHAGAEIGVASTKAFTTQLVALMMLTIAIGRHHALSEAMANDLVNQLISVPKYIEAALGLDKEIEALATRFADKQHTLFLGRGVQYPIAMEGALKLKELSYIHAEAYPAGELKHGPLALVDKHMPVVAIAPYDELVEKLKSNLYEVRARGGELIIFADADAHLTESAGITILAMPTVPREIAPIIYTIPLQLLAYHVAVLKGTDVDQPRNLAKSVTVE
jgi:glucosamine--fructose-6-phosphate aminotransferase (isomerizing)